MAKQTDRRGRLVAVPDSTKPKKLTLSSGHVIYVERMSYSTYTALHRRERELYPQPNVPVKDVEAAGGVIQVPVDADSVEGRQYRDALQDVARQRAEFRLDFIIDEYVTVEDADDDDGKAALIEQYAKELRRLERLGEEFEDDEARWSHVLRHCVLRSFSDYLMMQTVVQELTLPIGDDEVVDAADSFRGAVDGQADPDSETPGIAGENGTGG